MFLHYVKETFPALINIKRNNPPVCAEMQDLHKICRISDFYSGDYEFYLLGYNAVYSVESQPTFRVEQTTTNYRAEVQARKETSMKQAQAEPLFVLWRSA
jgi:hypothetical protein